MRAGGLDAGVFAVRGDHGTIRRNSSGRYAEYRKADPGELFQGSQDQLDKVLKAIKAEKIGLAQSPVGILEARKKDCRAPSLPLRAATLWKAICPA